MFCGQGRAGKTSLKRSLLNHPIDKRSDSTLGVRLSKATCHFTEKDGTCAWPEETDRATHRTLLVAHSVLSPSPSSSNTSSERQEQPAAVQTQQQTLQSGAPSDSQQQTPVGAAPVLHDCTNQPGNGSSAAAVYTTDEDQPAPAIAKCATLRPDAARSAQRCRTHGQRLFFLELWDFGGQRLYAFLQSMLLSSRRSKYLLAFDSSVAMDSVVEGEWFGAAGTEHHLTDHRGRRIHFQVLEEWLDMIFQTVTGPACVRLIGTKIDLVPFYRRRQWKADMIDYIRRHLRNKPYASLLNLEIMFIDNTRSGSRLQSPDGTALKLREALIDDIGSDSDVSACIPLRWLPFSDALQSDTGSSPVLSLDDVVTKAERLCGIKRKEVPDMLRFHHDLGLLLHFDDVPELTDYVVINVQWLVNITSALFHPLATGNDRFQPHYDMLHDHGILLESLVLHIWQTYCPVEAVHLAKEEQRKYAFKLLENFSMIHDTHQAMSPADHFEPSHAWLCPPFVRKTGDAVASIMPSPDGGERQAHKHSRAHSSIVISPAISFHCGKYRHFPQTQFWKLVVVCLCHFRDHSSSRQQGSGRLRKPFLFHASARLPCNGAFPCHQLCLRYFSQGVELIVLREDAAATELQSLGKVIPSLNEVCRKLLHFVEGKLQELNGGGAAQPQWSLAGRCCCPLADKPCIDHDRINCTYPGCHHFVLLSDDEPFCPLGDQPPQPKVLRMIQPVWLEVRQLLKRIHFT